MFAMLKREKSAATVKMRDARNSVKAYWLERKERLSQLHPSGTFLF